MAITRVSTAADGTQGNELSVQAAVSADGTKVAFYSSASTLVAGDTNGQTDLFVRDLTSGAITRVSTAADGSQANGSSSDVKFSADGNAIVFSSTASNLVAGDTNNATDVFVKNLTTGAVTRVSTDGGGGQSNGDSFATAISADGSKVAFGSFSTNLVAGDTNQANDVFVKDLTTGQITRVSSAADGTQANGNNSGGSLSADGTKVAFQSSASNLVTGDTNGASDVFLKDLTTNAVTRVSTAVDGTQSNSASSGSSLSADGTRIAFTTSASNLVAGDTNGAQDVLVRDLSANTLTCVSTAADGAQSDGPSVNAALSADGTRVAFESGATNLVTGDTNGGTDVFVKDLATGGIVRASVADDGTQNTASSFRAALSANGTKVAFDGPDGNLVAGDTNDRFDVFAADVPTDAGPVICFGLGTRIATPAGARRVEDLAAGDTVTTADGEAAVIWVGRRTIRPEAHRSPGQVRPVRIRAGAFGEGLPLRDLVLSPGHGVLVEGHLIPAGNLVNGRTIVQETVAEVTYLHVELPRHDILLAEGLPAESFLDCGDRAEFDGNGVTVLHPLFAGGSAGLSHEAAWAPFVVSGPALDAARARLEARAEALAKAETKTRETGWLARLGLGRRAG